jgi:hypothetical protein
MNALNPGELPAETATGTILHNYLHINSSNLGMIDMTRPEAAFYHQEAAPRVGRSCVARNQT